MYCTLTIRDSDILDFNKVHDASIGAFVGERKEIPELVAVRHINRDGTPVLITYKHRENGRVDVHFEIEGAMLRQSAPIGPLDMICKTEKPYFDLTAKINRADKKQRFELVKPPASRMYADWLNVTYKDILPNVKGHATNFLYIMSLHYMATRVIGYIPFALTYSFRSDGNSEARFSKDFIRLAEDGIAAEKKRHRLEHMFDGWDVVRLSWDQYNKVMDIVEDTGKITSPKNLPLKKFAVMIHDSKGEGFACRFEVTSEHHDEVMFFVELTEKDGDIAGIFDAGESTNPITGESKMICLAWEDDAKNDHLDMPIGGGKTTKEIIFDIFVNISSFLLNYKDETLDVEERICEAPSRPGKKNHNHRNQVRLFKTYTLKKNWKRIAARKKAEITCPAWGVRGHWRHYRDGRVIFINAYIKGKNRSEYKGKEYVLLPAQNLEAN